jgi:hypothetical protein
MPFMRRNITAKGKIYAKVINLLEGLLTGDYHRETGDT